MAVFEKGSPSVSPHDAITMNSLLPSFPLLGNFKAGFFTFLGMLAAVFCERDR
jgi:hypothetical protein